MDTAPIPVAGTVAPGFEPLRTLFAELLADEAGAAFALVRNGERLVDLWGGWTDRKASQAWQRDTLVCTFSCTKAMTALCIAQAVARGDLELDTPVAVWWPEFAAEGKQALPVRWLLSHQAGLPALRAPLPPEALYDWDTMAGALAAEAPWWPPGSAHGYHARTYGWLLGELLHRATGLTVGQWFAAEVAAPLGLDFHIGLPAVEHARVADLQPARVTAGQAPDPARAALLAGMQEQGSATALAFGNPPARGAYSNSAAFRAAELPAANGHGTARALADVYSVLAAGGGDLVPAATLAAFTAEAVNGPDRVLRQDSRFALGFMRDHPGHPLGQGEHCFGHAGAGGSLAFADPEQGLGMAFVMNRMRQGLVSGSPAALRLVQAAYACLAGRGE